ncbi:MAG: aldo/keto reductase [Prevotellaceae bacterium]|jgi:alcohol dehydrogenase (NADP+)|nr:aldo/keto reductase [Prevotellaceae bacterium]
MITFSNGDTMPLLGLGTWRASRDETYGAVLEALRQGYRHVDCAYIYGNEDVIGQALSDAFAQGVVKREELFVTSKLWNDAHESAHVEPALRQTLRDLQLSYLDLYLVHWPVALRRGTKFPSAPDEFLSLQQAPLSETWAEIERCQRQGLCRHIGVSNFTQGKLEALLQTATRPPEMNQVELHPYLQQPELVRFCQKSDIHVTAYSPLGAAKAKGGQLAPLLEHPTLLGIAKKHGATAAQVALAWGMARGVVVIPKSAHPARIAENLAARRLALDEADMEAIAAIDCRLRVTVGELWTMAGSPYTADYLWNC